MTTKTTTTHTPGPWTLETVPTSNGSGSCHKIGPFPSLGVYDQTHACVYADSVRIGIDDRGGVCRVADELLANARLMAAAPDLLAQLRAARDVLDSLLSQYRLELRDENAVVTAHIRNYDAIISRATEAAP